MGVLEQKTVKIKLNNGSTKGNSMQNINAYDSRLKEWMKHFHGIATKYLESYLGWMRLLDREKNISNRELLAIVARRLEIVQPLMRT